MSNADAVSRAIAFFEQSDDLDLLKEVLRAIQPRASAAVRRLQADRRQPPPPVEIAPAEAAATREEALATVEATRDFALLQAISRAAGRRVEALSG